LFHEIIANSVKFKHFMQRNYIKGEG